MTWGTGNWPIPTKVTKAVRRRDVYCQLNYHGCTQHIDEVDHIIPISVSGLDRRHAHDPSTLQGVCRHCHNIKTQREACIARNAWRRTPEPHPGLL